MCQAVKNPRAAREKRGENQTVFWGRIGVTQSAGSRYEAGRMLSESLAALLTIAYGTLRQADAEMRRIRREGIL